MRTVRQLNAECTGCINYCSQDEARPAQSAREGGPLLRTKIYKWPPPVLSRLAAMCLCVCVSKRKGFLALPSLRSSFLCTLFYRRGHQQQQHYHHQQRKPSCAHGTLCSPKHLHSFVPFPGRSVLDPLLLFALRNLRNALGGSEPSFFVFCLICASIGGSFVHCLVSIK